jgi:integrase
MLRHLHGRGWPAPAEPEQRQLGLCRLRTAAILLGDETPITLITDETVWALVQLRRKEFRRGEERFGLVKASTVNRTVLDTLKRALFHARDVKKVPIALVNWKKMRLKEAGARRREVSYEEEIAIEAAMAEGFHDCFIFALLCGIRRENFTELRWSEVDFQNRQMNIVQKGREPINPTITPEVDELLQRQKGLHPEFVFTFVARKTWTNPKTGLRQVKGQRYPITYNGFESEFHQACKRAGVTGVTIHDLRRTFGCRTTRFAGIAVASKAMHHSSIRITSEHYAHVENDAVRDALTQAQEAARLSKAEFQLSTE